MLQTITLTGADDSIEPESLFELSDKYPFVEWGILVSRPSGSERRPRWPSQPWLTQLSRIQDERTATGQPPIQLSLHFCGAYLRELREGRHCLSALEPLLHSFQRCQLNWHGVSESPGVPANLLRAFEVFARKLEWQPQVIFQLDDVNNWLAGACFPDLRVAGLYDASHGAGVTPSEWPDCGYVFPCGWSGGIGPDNIQSVLQESTTRREAFQPYWLDMETKIRSRADTQFDLAKCEAVLQAAERFVASKSVIAEAQ